MKIDSRFGHSEGITDLAFISDGKQLLTCGSDGDIRVWDGFKDPDPAAFSASDSCLSLQCFGETVFVGTENHTVEAYKLPQGKKIGVTVKFTAAVNHLDISIDGKLLVAGSGHKINFSLKEVENLHECSTLDMLIHFCKAEPEICFLTAPPQCQRDKPKLVAQLLFGESNRDQSL